METAKIKRGALARGKGQLANLKAAVGRDIQ